MKKIKAKKRTKRTKQAGPMKSASMKSVSAPNRYVFGLYREWQRRGSVNPRDEGWGP